VLLRIRRRMSLSQINFPEKNYNGDRYKFTIYLYDDDGTVYNGTIVKVNEFIFGNGSDDDEVIYPSGTKFEFLITSLNFATTKEVYEKLRSVPARLVVERYSSGAFNNFFDGLIDAEKNSNNLDIITQTIKIRALDEIRNLPNLITKAISLEPYVSPASIIHECLRDSVLSSLNGYPRLFDITDLGDYWTVTDTSDVVHAFTDFYVRRDGFFHPDVPFTTRKDVLYALFANFSAYGMIAPGKKFYLLPRNYDGSSVITITKSDLSGISFGSTKAFGNYSFFAFNGRAVYYPSLTRGTKERKIYFPVLDGEWDKTLYGSDEYNSLTMQAGLPHANVRIFSAQYKMRDGSYSEGDDFPNHADTLIVNYDNRIRYKPKVKLSGIKSLTRLPLNNQFAVDRWSVDKFYVFDFMPDTVFRVNKAAYNIMTDKAELTLMQC